MWYLWVIRHLENDPYITPTFLPEHLWVTEPGAEMWPPENDKKESAETIRDDSLRFPFPSLKTEVILS